MEWYTTAEECCRSFLPTSRRASANYCIGRYGEIWLNVEEKNRAWTSGSSANDNRAITIECANYMDSARYGVLPDATWAALVALCVDICKRNNIPKLNFTGNANGNLTMHKYFQDTNCPGPWLSENFGRLAKEVNAKLNNVPIPVVIGGTYCCRVNGLRVRTEPNLNGTIVAEYNMGALVELDDWYVSNDGYIWGRYTGYYSKEYRYIAIGRDTGKVEDDDFLVKI